MGLMDWQRPTGLLQRGGAVDVAATLAFAMALMWAAVWNGFPLIFPDSGTYFGIAYGHEYAIDRSSFYGFLLKPVLTSLLGITGLWLGIFLQCLVVAAGVAVVARRVVPGPSIMTLLPVLLALAGVTSVAWHAGQYMPDAFTGVLVLIAWLAASRDPGENGAPMLWVAATILALTHYTHLPLLAAVAAATILSDAAATRAWRSALGRGGAAIVSVGIASAVLITANGLALGRWSLTPLAPAFLFARLTEDGLTKPWLRDNCGNAAPHELCAIRDDIPDDSQLLLWGSVTPYATRIWYPPSDAERWKWIDMLGAANNGAVAARPLAFAANSLRGGAEQFASFQALDDLCPASCSGQTSGPVHALAVHRPDAVPALRASRQVSGTMAVGPIRAVTTPVAILAMSMVPLLLFGAVRRRDALAASLVIATTVALATNALLAGALSDVHDRYQSRIVWIVPFVVVLVIARWRWPRVRR